MAKVKAPEDQLSLAIGKEGQNVRLAAKLTGLRIEVEGVPVEQKEEDKKEPARPQTEIEKVEKKERAGKDTPVAKKTKTAKKKVPETATPAEVPSEGETSGDGKDAEKTNAGKLE